MRAIIAADIFFFFATVKHFANVQLWKRGVCYGNFLWIRRRTFLFFATTGSGTEVNRCWTVLWNVIIVNHVIVFAFVLGCVCGRILQAIKRALLTRTRPSTRYVSILRVLFWMTFLNMIRFPVWHFLVRVHNMEVDCKERLRLQQLETERQIFCGEGLASFETIFVRHKKRRCTNKTAHWNRKLCCPIAYKWICWQPVDYLQTHWFSSATRTISKPIYLVFR